jgi:hypothetical protein
MRFQGIERVIGGGQHLNSKLLEQVAGPETGFVQLCREGVVNGVCSAMGEAVHQRGWQSEDMFKLAAKPISRCCAIKERPSLGEVVPSGPGIDRATASSHLAERDAGGMEKPGHVVVRSNKERRGILESSVVRNHFRRHVAVRRNDGQLLHGSQEVTGDSPGTRVGRQQTVWMGG